MMTPLATQAMTTRRKPKAAEVEAAQNPTVPAAPPEAPPPSFADEVEALARRAIAGEGNHRQAQSCLKAAEYLHRLAGQYQMQIDAIKKNVPQGQRSGVRLSHLAHSVTRTIKDRDRYMREAAAALDSLVG